MAPESPAWQHLVAELEQIVRKFDDAVENLKKLHRNIDPARIPEPRPFPPLWFSLFFPPQLTSAPELPTDAVDAMYREMRSAALRYVQRELIARCPLKGANSRAQGEQILHQLCREIAKAALGGAIRDRAHAADPDTERLLLTLADSDLERAAREDVRHLFRLDPHLDRQILRALAVQKKELLNRVDRNELWFPDVIEPAASQILSGRESMPTGTREPPTTEAESPIAAAITAHKKQKHGRPPRQLTPWSILLANLLSELNAALAPQPPATLEDLARIAAMSRRRLCDLDKLPKDKKRRQAKEEKLLRATASLERPMPDLVAEIKAHRNHPPKSHF